LPVIVDDYKGNAGDHYGITARSLVLFVLSPT
jgi:hypothetical protein